MFAINFLMRKTLGDALRRLQRLLRLDGKPIQLHPYPILIKSGLIPSSGMRRGEEHRDMESWKDNCSVATERATPFQLQGTGGFCFAPPSGLGGKAFKDRRISPSPPNRST